MVGLFDRGQCEQCGKGLILEIRWSTLQESKWSRQDFVRWRYVDGPSALLTMGQTHLLHKNRVNGNGAYLLDES